MMSIQTRKIHRGRLVQELLRQCENTGGSKTKLPLNLSGTFSSVPVYTSSYPPDIKPWGRVSIRVYPGFRPLNETKRRYEKVRDHGIFVDCPHCDKEIPVGRYHQHVGTNSCIGPERYRFIHAIEEGDYLALSAYADWMEDQDNLDDQWLVRGLRQIVRRKLKPVNQSEQTEARYFGYHTWYLTTNPYVNMEPKKDGFADNIQKEEHDQLPGDWTDPELYSIEISRDFPSRWIAYLELAKILAKE